MEQGKGTEFGLEGDRRGLPDWGVPRSPRWKTCVSKLRTRKRGGGASRCGEKGNIAWTRVSAAYSKKKMEAGVDEFVKKEPPERSQNI